MDINQINLDSKFKLVEASAGTGKSFTLAHLVLRNVLEKKIKPDEILLLSFTKNTCSELRDKILLRFQHLKLYLQNNNENNNLIFSENLYKGACVKIKNSNKTFQVIGLNRGKEICWVREWPFACNSKKTFALEISQITLQIFCSNNSSE